MGIVVFAVQTVAFFTINNYHVRTKCASLLKNVPPKSFKSANIIILFLPNISLNIGHGNLLFWVQIEVTNTIYNYATK
jgi:hypothetical protein